MLLVCTLFSNYAAGRVAGMPNFARITPASVISDDVLLFLKSTSMYLSAIEQML